jgi:hypothetical protein
MSPSTRPNDIKPKREHQQTYRPVRLGKAFPSLPVRYRRRTSDASIWVLAICIVIAQILRTASDADSREVPQSYMLRANMVI